MYRSIFPRDMLAEMQRLQRDIQQAMDLSPSIRGISRGGFPAVNVGATPESVEIYVFAPGLDPSSTDISLDRGVLAIAGVRGSSVAAEGRSDAATPRQAVHINERFAGAFRRIITLPDDADPDAVEATYRDGVLRISVRRRASSQPRRIAIQ